MNKKLEKIFRMSQHKLKSYVAGQLRYTHKDIVIEDGYVYAQGTFPVLLVAHLDTVHTKLPGIIYFDFELDQMHSPNGIGGDDRCGVYMILEIVRKYNCSVLFCEDEEIGGVGARKFVKTSLAKNLEFNYIIEFDRKGKNDAVFYDCDNPEFESFITQEFYETSYGSYSDISTIAPALKCAAVNLSCGYYNPHMTSEYVVLHEIEDSIEAACNILKRTTENDKFEYIERIYGYGCYNGYSRGWNDDDYYTSILREYNFYCVEYADKDGKTQWHSVCALSQTEAIGNWLIACPHLCYNDMIDVYIIDKEY